MTGLNRIITAKELNAIFTRAMIIREGLRLADPRWAKLLAIHDIKEQPFYG